MTGEFLLLCLIIIGLIGRSPILSTAASLLLIIKLTALNQWLIPLEQSSLDIGLLCLTMAVLVPFATEKISWQDMKPLFTTFYGFIALCGGALATYMNRQGLHVLQNDPEMIIGLVIGSIFGIIFLRGVPVGPLMAAGITAFFLYIMRILEAFFI
jgi:uncharacterized membrane protein (DUF441 family)